MFAYVMRRLIYMPFILLGVIFITFALFELTSTPEAQAKKHIGEKSSQRQIYDYLESKGLISWTDAGEKKVEATSTGKLPASTAHFLSSKFVKETPEQISEFYDYAEGMLEDVDELLEDHEISPDKIAKAIAKKRTELKLPANEPARTTNAEAANIAENVSIFANLEVKISLLQEFAKGDDDNPGDKNLIKEYNKLRGKHGTAKNKAAQLAAKWAATIKDAQQEHVIISIGEKTFETAEKYKKKKGGLKNAEARLLEQQAIFINPKDVQAKLEAESNKDKKAKLEAQLLLAKEHFVDLAAIKAKLAAAEANGKDTNELTKELAAAEKTILDARAEITDTKKDIVDRSEKVLKLKPDGEIASAKSSKAQKAAEKAISSFEDIEADFAYTGFATKFGVYIWDIMTLDLGDTNGSRPVTSVIYEGMWPSLMLSIPAFFISEMIGVLFGLFAAMYRRTKIDSTIVVSSILLMSINAIALIMFGQKFIAADLNYFPVTGFAEGLGAARFLVLPIFLYVVISFGGLIRFNRIIMLDETNQDYVRTARAKGLGENRVLFKHILRNTLIPMITRWAVAIPSLYMGTLVLEKFFSIPGLGYLTVDAIINSDTNVIRTVVVFGSVSFMLANLLSDVLYAVADPRVKLN